MKIKFLIAGLLGLISVTAFAQKGDVNNAQSEFDKFQLIKQGTLATTALANAQASIDKAIANPKTATWPQAYALKGAIYANLAVQEKTPATATTLFGNAEEALKKAKELDTKNEYAKIISEGSLALAQYQLTAGVNAYQAAQYDVAYKAFDYYRSILPEDTTAIYYTGLAAYNSKNYPAAITNYSKLVTTKYSQGERIYDELSGMYLVSKDTTGALKAISEGLVKYPNSATLRKKEIEIALQSGKSQQVLDKINAAIANDPKNKDLYYYAGLVYSQSGDVAYGKVKGTKDAAGKTALKAKATEDYGKAGEMYKKALEIDPNYFEANLNLGYILLTPAIDSFNTANNLPGTAAAQKQYDALMAKASTQFDAAKPFLQKAVDLKPNSRDALANLITYYRGKKDQANVDKYSKIMDAIKE
ncbi:tetratricopeptide repeat protein [Mucilaginibacter psychrotolerans]|uniref:Tetratricopeptide repeat protein n=1 Tax=Mucilaginibacter psychrotolerans TaxID=1524096 RepID=A0A4Y8SKL6_9SPHI|nr:tetratricopeptide repeat protein [Mucilaginibacter psychrotolerans]TFF39619.1 tetratricopeptide repeat protein [Mucilaginibacter psychrotolerans]